MRHYWPLALALCVLAKADDITPRVGLIEVYGARKVSAEKIRSAIQAKAGDRLPSREQAEERIDKLSGILASRVEAACCSNRNMILYVGVQERDAPHVEYNPAPTSDVQLPASLYESYRSLLDSVEASLRGRNADEDLTNGYSLMADPESRELQQSFLPAVEQNLVVLDKVIRQSADAEQRAAAAYLLQYGPRGPHVIRTTIDALQYALRDQEDMVRENAIHSLHAIELGAKLHPNQGIQLEPTWFVELMNSVVWSDRRNASLVLVDITESRNPDTLQLLRDRALPSVLEMARWHDLKHALPAFILAGRLAGMDEKAIKQAWLGDDRETVLKEALKRQGKHFKYEN
ncbi:MAG TPA: hypothetical protein VK604_08690 [Bryobacteraceae bacterium]|nr:hypothetical protein [Bryobacteraceae bacterium]